MWKLQKGNRGCGGVWAGSLYIWNYINKTIITTRKKLVIKITQHNTFYTPTITCEALSPLSQLSFVGPNAVGRTEIKQFVFALWVVLMWRKDLKSYNTRKVGLPLCEKSNNMLEECNPISRWWGTAVTRQWSSCYCYQLPPMENWGELIIIQKFLLSLSLSSKWSQNSKKHWGSKRSNEEKKNNLTQYSSIRNSWCSHDS